MPKKPIRARGRFAVWPGRIMREPHSLADFEEKTGFQLGQEQLLNLTFPGVDSLFGKNIDFPYAVDSLHRNLPHSTGNGRVHVIFPLASMERISDFYKGVLKVIAPNARTTVLVAPPSFKVDDMKAAEYPIEVRNLRRRLSKSVRRGSTHFLIVDDIGTGDNTKYIADQIRSMAPGAKVSRFDPVSPELDTRPIGFNTANSVAKDDKGAFAMGAADTLNHLLQHPEDYDNGRFHKRPQAPITLLTSGLHRFFPKEEAEQLRKRFYGGDHRILDYIRALPPSRQRLIIKKVREEEVSEKKAIYYAGKAAARDYLKQREIEERKREAERALYR